MENKNPVNTKIFQINKHTERFLIRQKHTCWNCKKPMNHFAVSKRARSRQNYWCFDCAYLKHIVILPFIINCHIQDIFYQQTIDKNNIEDFIKNPQNYPHKPKAICFTH